MRTKGEIEALIGALRHPEAGSEAQKALIEIGAPAVPLLINALRDRDISLAAAGVLREIGTVAVEPLIAALGNENKRVSVDPIFMVKGKLEQRSHRYSHTVVPEPEG